MGFLIIFRALAVYAWCASAVALTPLSAVGDDNDCALYLSGPGRTSAYDYSLNLLKGNFGYEGQHTCITYDAVNRAYLEARNRIVVAQPKGDWKPEDFASVGELVLDISINLARTYGLTYEEIEKGLPLIDTSKTLIREACPPVFSHVECRAGKYRRLDGLCNNLKHPTWGSINAPFQRLIGPLFADGINSPRISHTGRDLPLSRVVSRTMHPDEGYHDHAGTVMIIAWGQFMDHDYTLTGTPLDPRSRNDPEECCKRPQHLKHPYCNEIRVPDDDYFYRLWGVKCIDFVRAFPSPRPGCRLGSRVPFNTLTGVLDGNTVYGVTEKFARKLRMGYGGLLRMNPVFKDYGLKDLLPLKLDIPDEGCTRPNKNMYCFEAGEIRVNEQLVLTVMHTLMAREHNRVAHGLANVNPHWDDETLYQEARRINIAEIQHITYNEFLPILLGKDVMEKFGLVLEKEGYWNGYDSDVNPDVIASFASAAYRFGHSLLPTAVERWSKAHKFIASKRLSDLIRRPFDLYRAGVLDEYVMGLSNQVAQAMDDSITQEVTNHLFKKPGQRFGMDLVSFNMQRGREFGIPGYMEFRKFCGLPGAETFQDLFGTMTNETVHRYQTIFEHPVDVDLWSGGVSERALPGSMLGPTFACIIATQFSYSRRGDRFWFELPNQPSSFTPPQLAEIRKSRLARIICDNTDLIDSVQLFPFVLPDHELNPRVPCRSGIVPSMDFSKWAEPGPFNHGAKQFITNAVFPVKNEDNCVTEDVKIENATDVKCGCSYTTDIVGEAPQIKTVTNNAVETDTINEDNTVACTETQAEIETNNTEHVLTDAIKYQMLSNQPEHVLLRRKRSNLVHRNLRYAANIPLIRYRVPDKPKEEFIHKDATNVINTAALADFHIETLHSPGAIQPIVKKAQIFGHPQEYIAKKYETTGSAERSNDSGDYLAKTISKPFVAIPESNEKNYRDDGKSGVHKPVILESLDLYKKDYDINLNRDVTERQPPKANKVQDSDKLKYTKSNGKIYKASDGESIETGDSGEYSNDKEVNDTSTDTDEKGNSRLDEKSSDEDNEEKNGSEEITENNTSNERGKSKNNKNRADNNERSRYLEQSIEDEPYRNSNSAEKLKRFQFNVKKQPYREKSVKYKYDDNNDKRFHKKHFRKSMKLEKKKNYKPRDDDNNHDQPSEESSENQSKPVTITEDSRENIRDDIPEHRGHGNNDSGDNQQLDDYNSESKETNDNAKDQSEETDYPISPYAGKKDSYTDNRSQQAIPRDDITDSDEKNYQKPIQSTWYPTNQYSAKPRPYNERRPKNSQLVAEDSSENEDHSEEAVIFVMNKNKKANSKTHDKYIAKNSPKKRLDDIRDVDLRNYDHERIKVNHAGKVEPIHDKKHGSKQKIIDSQRNFYDDVDVRPVVEIKRENGRSGKESVKSNENNEDSSLETVLGINKHDENAESENVNPDDENRDVKQDFERIPVNNNNHKKIPEQNQEEKEPDAPETTEAYDIDETLTKLGLLKPIEPVRYDENLNIKFDDEPIILPEIKLPDDVLTFDNDDYKEPENKDSYSKKNKNSNQIERAPNSYDSREDADRRQESEENVSHDGDESDYYGPYGPGKKNSNKKQKTSDEDGGNEEDNDDEEEDLYEKFVRERFGKRGSFEKRSENLLEGRPAKRPLFDKLHQVLKKTENIEKEAARSGDPNAGYMWTLEYGRPL